MALCIELKITQNFTTVAHSQANGQVEVINRVLVDGMKKILKQENTNRLSIELHKDHRLGRHIAVWFLRLKLLCLRRFKRK